MLSSIILHFDAFFVALPELKEMRREEKKGDNFQSYVCVNAFLITTRSRPLSADARVVSTEYITARFDVNIV